MQQHHKQGHGREPTFPEPERSRLLSLRPPATEGSNLATKKIEPESAHDARQNRVPPRPTKRSPSVTSIHGFERAAEINRYAEAWTLLLKRKKAHALWQESQLRAREVQIVHTPETLLAIEHQEEREELMRWHIGKLQYAYASRIQTDHQFLIDQHCKASSTSRGGSGGGRIRMINAQTGQQMEHIHDPDFRNFTLVEAKG